MTTYHKAESEAIASSDRLQPILLKRRCTSFRDVFVDPLNGQTRSKGVLDSSLTFYMGGRQLPAVGCLLEGTVSPRSCGA